VAIAANGGATEAIFNPIQAWHAHRGVKVHFERRLNLGSS
jgi:hypothetical protein